AHLEPEILIVDEVLAVGDTDFQKKCLGKMENVSKDGRTVLFVSHNMDMVAKLCSKGLILQGGRIGEINNVDKVIANYISQSNTDSVLFEAASEESALQSAILNQDALYEENLLLKITHHFPSNVS